ncbi:YbaN family protein [Blastopirellula retiformator]|uniref:Inner membrane protein YbaN n=1 Tax=Blastopirellula retiformator TaxID=2527970 RepID=A0A5C5V3N5_9BACT|nr:YbaN family protein [Blastopirellula retiformator]TWT33174.1 Inner membrane protein YbaN [Blastopirellula retiformator]
MATIKTTTKRRLRIHAAAPLSTPPRPPEKVHGLRRVIFVASAVLFLTLGVLGAILPVLPCTPFLLLASYFAARSSPWLNERILRNRLVGPILRDWNEHRGVRRHVKIKAMLLVGICVTATLAITQPQPLVMVMIAGVSTIGIVVVAKLPEVK